MPSMAAVEVMPSYQFLTRFCLLRQYWREYRTYFHSCSDWGIHEATAYRTVKRIEDILVKASEFRLPGKRQLQQAQTAIEVIVVDVTETEIERPQKNRNTTIVASRGVIH